MSDPAADVVDGGVEPVEGGSDVVDDVAAKTDGMRKRAAAAAAGADNGDNDKAVDADDGDDADADDAAAAVAAAASKAVDAGKAKAKAAAAAAAPPPKASTSTSSSPSASSSSSSSSSTTTPAAAAASSSSASSSASVDPRTLLSQPHKVPAFVESAVTRVSAERSFLVFALVWLPCALMLAGTVVHVALDVALNSLHFFAGGAGAYYVYMVVSDARSSPREKTEAVFAVTSLAPVLMVDAADSFIVRLLVLVAFGGTTFLRRVYFPHRDAAASKPQNAWALQLLDVAVAPAVIYDVATGGSGYLNALVQAGCFYAALLATQRAYPFVEPHVAKNVPVPFVQEHKELVYALLELLLAHVVTCLLAALLPAFLFAGQNGMLSLIFYTLVGAAVFGGGAWLADQPAGADAMLDQAKLGFTAATVASMLALFIVWTL